MRNGVEVIVATDRIARPVEPEYLRIISSTVIRPITLAPHTLTNLMSMVLSSEKVTSDKSNFMHFLQPTLTTKTFYTTYKYKATISKKNSTAITDSQTVVTNVETEPIKSTETKNFQTEFTSVISASPTMRTEVYSTAYTYLNTILDGDQFVVASSTQTLTNSIIGIRDGFNDLEPSEVFPTTNTYLTTLELTKTLTDGTDYQVISTRDVATQVVVTDKVKKETPSLPSTTDVTKTYFVTYTYFSTYVEGDKTKVKSDVSVSSDVITEKFYIKHKKTSSSKNAYDIKKTESPLKISSSHQFPFNIVATKTYLTTRTYYTTLLHGTEGDSRTDYKTKVVENTVAETIPPEYFKSEYLISLNSSLNKISGSLVATATLRGGGDPIVITAFRDPVMEKYYQKFGLTTTKLIPNDLLKTELNQIDGFEKQSASSEATLSEPKFSLKESKSHPIKITSTKINQPTAEALFAAEEEIHDTVTPTIVMTKATPVSETLKTHVVSSSKILSSDFSSTQIVNENESEGSHLKEKQPGEVSTSAATPDKQNQDLKQSKNQTNVGALLNGINVLKPVLNAMAELINNQINKNSEVVTRRNDTENSMIDQDLKKPQSSNLNPLLSFVNKFTPTTTKSTGEAKTKATTPRTPLYIPVGSFAQDSDVAGNQHNAAVLTDRQDNWDENLKNIEGKNFEKLRTQDPITILEGGIPISPGEVITTNSDVIIGRPGEGGPRPPKIVVKNNVPVDMKPPPMPPLIINEDDEDHFVGQQSTHTGINFDLNGEKENAFSFQRQPPSLHKKPNHEIYGFKNGHSNQNDKRKGSNHQKNSQFYKPPRVKYDSGTMDLNPPPMPPLPVRTHDIHRPITINHEQEQKAAPKKTSQNVISIPIHLDTNQNVENYLNPAEISSSGMSLSAIPLLSEIQQPNFAHLGTPTPGLEVINQEGILQVSTVPQIALHLPPPINQNSVERSTGHPLLVNIQPSQVANIVIPHGSSSALIVSGNKQHSLKGEVIDEPSPHPESEAVGFVGAEPLLKIESGEVPISAHNEVVSTNGEDKTKTSTQNNRIIFLHNPHLQTELIQIRPKPLKINKLPEQHFPQELQTQVHLSPNPFGSSGTNQDIILENHRQVESHNQNGESKKHLPQSHHHEGQNSGMYFSHNLDLHSLNSVKGNIGTEVYLNKNLNEEGQNINLGVPNTHGNFKGALNSKKEFENSHYYQAQAPGDISSVNSHNEPVRSLEGQNVVKNGNGIYVDISPPGHLSPRPDAVVGSENHSSNTHFSDLKENLSHHQFGSVHDVPLNVQVQLGSGPIRKENNPLKDLLVNVKTPNTDSLPHNSNANPKFTDSQNSVKRPINESPDYLSPPPLFTETNTYSFVRPPLNRPQSKPASQKFPVQSQQNIRRPVDFMVPPPQIFSGPPTKVKPHLELNSRPVIPIGAGAPLHGYTHPKQEDMVIVPNKNRPTIVESNFGGSYEHDYHSRPIPTKYSDLDTSGTSRPFKTEYGEEIQESISLPLLPGEVPNDLKKLEKNITNIYQTNHKLIENSKSKPFTKVIDKTKNHQNFGEKTTDKIPVINGYWDTRPWANNSSFWTNIKNNVRIKGENKQTPGLTYSGVINDSVFANINKPSGFVSKNITDDSSHKNHADFNRFENHKETYGFVQPNNKGGNNLSNHRDSTFSFESIKISSKEKNTHQSDSQTESTANIPSGFVVSGTNSLIESTRNKSSNAKNEQNTHVEFNKNEKNAEIQTLSSNTNHRESQPSVAGQNQTIKPPSIHDSNKWKEIVNSKNDSAVGHQSFANKNADAVTISKDSKPFTVEDHEFDRVFGTGVDQTFTNTGQGKFPNNYGVNKNHRPGFNQRNSSRPSLGYEGQVNAPTKSSHVREPSSATLKFNSNKNNSLNINLNPTKIKKPSRYPISNGISQPGTPDTAIQNTLQVKRPSGFISNKKEESNVGILNVPFKNSVASQTTEIILLPSNGNNLQHPGASIPSGFINKNATFSELNLNHNYGNKTINLYKDKVMNTSQEQTIIYDDDENEADKLFFTKYGNINGNVDNGAMPTKINKLVSSGTQRNTTTFVANAGVSSSDTQLSVLTHPKITGLKTKPEEVMGLSPPPLERPRRPQKPQRPKPSHKFDVPTTPKSSLKPIAIENDFPPVRSPDFNKKPLKPQDNFPPRLPPNFVHHLPEYPITTSQSRPRPTSLPIDLPVSSTTEKRNKNKTNADQYNEFDSLFAGAEINGHSKPFEENPLITENKPYFPVPDLSKEKLHNQSKLPTNQHQTVELRGKENENSKTDSDRSKQSVAKPSIKEDISPSRTINAPMSTTYHTKVTASVTPTFTHPYNEWQDSDIITGSETIFDPEQFSTQATPTISDFETKKKMVTTLISTGSTTIFGNFYTGQPFWNSEEATKPSLELETQKRKENSKEVMEFSKPFIQPTPTMAPVITTTLTVTSTMTTIVHSIGRKPSLKTVVVTKTLISTVFNKVTETKTLVQPTTATIIQTHTISTTKTALVIPTAHYPPQIKYPTGGSLKPEIFVADPHSKDTMTISVSSSMNKNKNNEENGRPNGHTVTNLDQSDKDSILVVMTNKHPNIELPSHDDIDVVANDEDNEIDESRVLMGGVFNPDEKEHSKGTTECYPECKAKKNELCQKIDGLMKCVCRPGFARMFPDRPCKPTYTYNVKLLLDKYVSEHVAQEKLSSSPNMAKLTSMTKEGLDRMIMQSELRDVYHGIMVNGFQNKDKSTMVDFYVQLSENTDEEKLINIFKKTLHASNYSLGGTELFAARAADNLNAKDFNECQNPKFHDCSEHARCFNLKGTYTCSCKEGFTDISENTLFPGRVCSDMIGCEYCGYHGACFARGEGQMTCECFHWYSGDRCHINLKVFLIALVTIGAILLALLLVCAVFTCINRRNKKSATTKSHGYLRYRGPSSRSIDRRAMIADSSSESSVDNLPYINPPPPLPIVPATSNAKKKSALRHVKGPAPKPVPLGMEQRDKSVMVMIPRAKYRPMPPLSPHLTMSTFSPDKHLLKTASQVASEQKLISYLDGNTREDRTTANAKGQNNRSEKEQQKVFEYKISGANNDSPRPAEKKEFKIFEYEYKISNMLFSEETNSAERKSVKSSDERFRRHSDSTQLHSDHNREYQFRKYSEGALVSAGYEVSAKVGMHHLEEDTTEDDHSGILNTHTMKSNRSQFTTLNRTGDHKTMSEARSYEETTVHPQTRSLKTHYSGSSPSIRANNDFQEGHTMIERDSGSTFVIPESQLFKPEADRGSDISNFDSL